MLVQLVYLNESVDKKMNQLGYRCQLGMTYICDVSSQACEGVKNRWKSGSKIEKLVFKIFYESDFLLAFSKMGLLQ